MYTCLFTIIAHTIIFPETNKWMHSEILEYAMNFLRSIQKPSSAITRSNQWLCRILILFVNIVVPSCQQYTHCVYTDKVNGDICVNTPLLWVGGLTCLIKLGITIHMQNNTSQVFMYTLMFTCSGWKYRAPLVIDEQNPVPCATLGTASVLLVSLKKHCTTIS